MDNAVIVTQKTKNKNTNLIIRGTSKIFRYNAGVESIVDGNTAQQPFIQEYKGERKTALEYVWYTKGEANEVHKRGLLVSGHGEYGVPTLYDYDVYVALQDMFINKNSKNGICELKQEDINEDDLRISFTINELAKEMGYVSPNNLVREKIEKSLETLLATTVFSIYEGGIYDIKNKKYITSKTVGFHYLEQCEKYKVKDENGNDIFDLTNIKLSSYTYNQILNDYKLFYNRDSYKKIKNRMAKKIYHLILQWRGNKNKLYVNLNTIIEKVPMIEEDKRFQKRYVKKALKLLSDNGIVRVDFDVNDQICCDFTGGESDKALLAKYNNFSEVKEYLYKIGFSLIEIEELIEKQRHVQALLRYMEDRNKNKMSDKSTKKYIITALKNIKIDSKYYTYGD